MEKRVFERIVDRIHDELRETVTVEVMGDGRAIVTEYNNGLYAGSWPTFQSEDQAMKMLNKWRPGMVEKSTVEEA